MWKTVQPALGLTQQPCLVAPQVPQSSDSPPCHPLERGVAEQAAQDAKLNQERAGPCCARLVDAVGRHAAFQIHLCKTIS